MSKKPFCEEDYRIDNSSHCPIVDVLVGKTNQKITTYVDTGCTSGIALLQSQIGNLSLGEKINDEPVPVLVGDGHKVGADVYIASVELNGEKKDVEIHAIDPTKMLGSAPVKECIPCLGREFLDHYDIHFTGNERFGILRFYK